MEISVYSQTAKEPLGGTGGGWGEKKTKHQGKKKRTKQKPLSAHHPTDRATKNITRKTPSEKQVLSRHEVKERSL